MKIFFVTLILSLFITSRAYAEDVYEYKEDVSEYKEPVYQDPTGVQVNSSFRAIISSGESELHFGDRKDIRQAIKKATMRAKGEIAKFLKESIKSKDTINNIEKVVSMMDDKRKENASRETIETQIEVLESSANELLSGVVTLKQDINKDEKFVIVILGIKKETIGAAMNIRSEIRNGIRNSGTGKVSLDRASNNSPTIKGREIRKSPMYDKF